MIENNQQHNFIDVRTRTLKVTVIMLISFLFVNGSVLGGNPEKGKTKKAENPPVVNASTGDFMPDTVNVFEIAKDVSQVFAEAIQFSSLNDVYGDTAYLNALFTGNYATNEAAEAYKKDVEARIKSQRGDIGVNFKADYSENFKPGFSPDEDIYYKRRFYFGVEWNVINGGFLESRSKANQLKKEYSLKDVDAKQQADRENYRYIFNYINYLFNKQKIEVLRERYSLIEKQLNFTNELYHLRYVGWENVLHVRAKLEDINQQIGQLEQFNRNIPNSIPDSLLNSNYSADKLPLVDIDLDKLMSVYHDNATTDTIAALKMAMYSDGMKWWQDVSLRPYLRYNLYVDPLNQRRTFASGGIALNVPLRFKNKENLVEAKSAIFAAEGEAESKAGDNELVNHYAEFAFKLKQIKEFYYKKLYADELIRKELVKKDFQDIGFNPIFTLGLIDDKKNIEAEIIDIKKRLYIQLLQMAFYLDQKSPLAFVEVITPDQFTSRYSTNVQVFVDKATYDEMDNNALVNYLWQNEFRDVILGIDSWRMDAKFYDLLNKASRDHIFFTLNKKIPEGQNYPDVNGDLQEIAALNNAYIKGLHYSLAMNTDGSTAPEVQEVNFSDWLDGINTEQKPSNIRLSISISDNLPMNILNKVFAKFDLVFVPSDGTPNRGKLEQALLQEMSLGKEKLTVVLNANDFADRLHIENYMNNLSDEVGVENFAFSNVKNMIQADLRTFEMGEQNQMPTEELMNTFRNQIFADDKKNKEILHEKLDTIANIVKERNENAKEAANAQITVEIIDKRTQENTQAEPIAQAVADTAKEVPASKVWQIQIAASKVTLTDAFLQKKFNVKEPIATHRVNGYYKYTIGQFNSENEARAALKNYKTSSGNAGAFIVSYE